MGLHYAVIFFLLIRGFIAGTHDRSPGVAEHFLVIWNDRSELKNARGGQGWGPGQEDIAMMDCLRCDDPLICCCIADAEHVKRQPGKVSFGKIHVMFGCGVNGQTKLFCT